MEDLCISILEFKCIFQSAITLKFLNLCISILEFKLQISHLSSIFECIYVFLYQNLNIGAEVTVDSFKANLCISILEFKFTNIFNNMCGGKDEMIIGKYKRKY